MARRRSKKTVVNSRTGQLGLKGDDENVAQSVDPVADVVHVVSCCSQPGSAGDGFPAPSLEKGSCVKPCARFGFAPRLGHAIDASDDTEGVTSMSPSRPMSSSVVRVADREALRLLYAGGHDEELSPSGGHPVQHDLDDDNIIYNIEDSYRFDCTEYKVMEDGGSNSTTMAAGEHCEFDGVDLDVCSLFVNAADSHGVPFSGYIEHCEFAGVDLDACSLFLNEADRGGVPLSGYIAPVMVPYMKNDEAVAGCLSGHGPGAPCDTRSTSRPFTCAKHLKVVPFPVLEFMDCPEVGELISSMGFTENCVADMPEEVYSQLQIVVGWKLRHLCFAGDDHCEGLVSPL